MAGHENPTLVRPGSQLGKTVLFLAQGRAWTVDDAIVSAASRHDLEVAMDETLEFCAAEQRAEEEALEIEADELQKRSEQFRYDHDLISAGETEDWLAARAITLDDFSAWLYRKLCAETVETAPAEDMPEDFPDLLRVHLWLSGRMEGLTKALRRRVASQIELASESLSLDEAYERVVRQVLDEDARRRRLAMQRLPLTRIAFDSLELDSDEAAREACLCARDDQLALTEVAHGAGYHVDREVMWSDEVERRLSPHAVFAAEGEVIGPLAAAHRFKVYQVARRIEPSLDDPEIADRVDTALLDEYFEELCSRHTQLPLPARTES